MVRSGTLTVSTTEVVFVISNSMSLWMNDFYSVPGLYYLPSLFQLMAQKLTEDLHFPITGFLKLKVPPCMCA